MAEREYVESGLTFRFDEDSLFKPDMLPTRGYAGVKGCDFLWCANDGSVAIIEVKSSIPKNSDDLARYLDELQLKLVHSSLLWLSSAFGRHPNVQVPNRVISEEVLRSKPQFFLVIAGLPVDHESRLTDTIRKKLRPIQNAFAMEAPFVLSHSEAHKRLAIPAIEASTT